MNRRTAGSGRRFGAPVIRAALCLCCALILLLSAAAGAAGETASTWEERLQQARKKYNEKTVNVFAERRGYYKRGRINACFYQSADKTFMFISVRESLKITDEAEMQAILEVIAKNELYSEEVYGTISFMKAQWITHNIAYSMATGSEEERETLEMLTGEDITDIAGHAQQLDLSPLTKMTEKQLLVYRLVEMAFCHPDS